MKIFFLLFTVLALCSCSSSYTKTSVQKTVSEVIIFDNKKVKGIGKSLFNKNKNKNIDPCFEAQLEKNDIKICPELITIGVEVNIIYFKEWWSNGCVRISPVKTIPSDHQIHHAYSSKSTWQQGKICTMWRPADGFSTTLIFNKPGVYNGYVEHNGILDLTYQIKVFEQGVNTIGKKSLIKKNRLIYEAIQRAKEAEIKARIYNNSVEGLLASLKEATISYQNDIKIDPDSDNSKGRLWTYKYHDSRHALVKKLGVKDDPRAVEAIIKVLDDENELLRQTAANVLGEIGCEQCIEALKTTALHDNDEYVRQAAQKGLYNIDLRSK